MQKKGNMADGITIEIKGLEETAAALREIPEKFASSPTCVVAAAVARTYEKNL